MGPAAIVPLALAAVGAVKGEEERAAINKQNRRAAAQNRFADVTGRFVQARPQGGGAFGGAIQGGTAGLGIAASGGAFDNLFKAKTATDAAKTAQAVGGGAQAAQAVNPGSFSPLAVGGLADQGTQQAALRAGSSTGAAPAFGGEQLTMNPRFNRRHIFGRL